MRGGNTRVYRQTDSERQGGLGRRRGPHAACASFARQSEPDRHPCRLRHQPVRRLRRPYRRPCGEILHGAGRAGVRLQCHHHRRHRQGRRAAPDAGGIQRQSWPAVRLLHAGHDHVVDRHRQSPRRQARRGHGPPGARRQYLPLHRLSQHRQGRAGCSRPHEGRAGRRIAIGAPFRSHQSARRASTEFAAHELRQGGQDMGVEGIGASVVRKEDKRFITGKGRYVDDIKLVGMSFAHFVRSPHAHARVKSIDSSAAMKMPGVIAVLTGKELVDDKIGNLICGWAITSKDGTPMKMGAWPAMAPETVRFVGQAVAVVIADSRNLAKDAAEAVVVNYEELPSVPDIKSAVKPGAPQLHPEAPGNIIYDWVLGDEAATNAAFAKAANVVSMDLVNNRLVPNAMEPRAAIADYDTAEEHFTLYTTSQNPHVARLVLSAFYNIAPEHKLRVIAPDVGGGFGSKIFIYPEEMVALWASKKVGRPVKWTGDRSESFLTDAHGRDHVTKAELAFDKDNKILALRVKTHANFGAYMSLFSSAVPTYFYATLLSGQYIIPAIHAEVIGVYTNTTPVDAYRGAGRPEASYLLERMMETAARQLKVDPAALRRQNFITQFPYQTPVIMAYDVGDFNASIDAAMKAIDYAGFPARKAKAKAER